MRFLAISLFIFALAPFAFADDGAPEGECRYGRMTFASRSRSSARRAALAAWPDYVGRSKSEVCLRSPR